MASKSSNAQATRFALTGTCHCGAVRIRVRQAPRTVTSCNCSICRRYGALWAYYQASSVQNLVNLSACLGARVVVPG